MFMGRLPRALRIDHLHHDLDQSLFCLVKFQQKRKAVFHHERLLKTHQHNVVTTWRKQHIFMGGRITESTRRIFIIPSSRICE